MTNRSDCSKINSARRKAHTLVKRFPERKEKMLEFVQQAYGYNKETDGFKVFEDIYDEFFNNKPQKKEKKKK